MKNGALCLFSGTSLVSPSATAIAPSTLPTNIRPHTAGTNTLLSPCTPRICLFTGSGILPTAKRTDSDNSNVEIWSLEKLSLNFPGRRWKIHEQLLPRRVTPFLLMAGVSVLLIPKSYVLFDTLSETNTLSDGYARKIHYSCDLFFAINWGLITGFKSPFPWFYPVFFAVMIAHRALRDIQRCRAKYGEAWAQYEKEVPYLFIPVSFACTRRIPKFILKQPLLIFGHD